MATKDTMATTVPDDTDAKTKSEKKGTAARTASTADKKTAAGRKSTAGKKTSSRSAASKSTARKSSAKAAAPAKPAVSASSAPKPSDALPKTKQSLVSVNQAKLDQLMDLVGELVTTESMVVSNPDLKGLRLDNFNKSTRELHKLTDELQDVVMSIRWCRFPACFRR